MRYQLREYQVRAEQAIRDALRSITEGRRSVLVWSPTGSGKTVIGCSMMEQCEAKARRSLFLAPQIELVDQTCEKIEEIGVKFGVIRGDDPRWDPSALVQVGSVQTVARRLRRLDLDFDLCIVDEAHSAVAATTQQIIEALPERCIVVGLSATPFRSDGLGLGRVFKKLYRVATVAELMDLGFLVWPRYFRGQAIDRRGLRTRAGEFIESELAERSNKPKLIGNIVSEWRKNAEGLLTMGYAVNVEHSRAIVEAFTSAGIPAEHVDGSLPRAQQKAVLARMRRRETLVVINCQLYVQGLDVPELQCLIDAQPTKSLLRDRQKRGRLLRPFPGKDEAIILDHAGNTDVHGYVHEEPEVTLEDGIIRERPRPSRRCPKCDARFAGAPPRCPACGAVLKAATGERTDEELPGLRDDGHVLVEDERGAPKKRERSQRDLEFLLWRDVQEMRAKGHKPHWVRVRHLARSGVTLSDAEILAVSPIRTAEVGEGASKRRVML